MASMTDGQTGWVALASLAAGLVVGARWVGQAVANRRADSWIIGRLGLQGRLAALNEPARADEEAARTAQRVEELLGHVTQAVVAVDGRDRLILANPGARELLRLGEAGAGEPFVPLARSAELVDFLRQFPDEQEIGFYLIAEDVTPYVGLHPDTGYDPDDEAWPIIVTSFVPYDQVP